jgi:hypothetical protein
MMSSLSVMRRFYCALPLPLEALISDEAIDYKISGDLPASSFLFSTAKGIFIYSADSGRVAKILNGKYYGLVKYGDYWIVARLNDRARKTAWRLSDIFAITLKAGQVVYYKPLLWGIPGEIHQIGILNDCLYIPHTEYSQILYAPLKGLFATRFPKSILACRSIKLEIPKPAHLNSFFHDKEKHLIYIIAHNKTVHTGRCSDVLVCDEDFSKLDVVSTTGNSVHNVCTLDGEIIYCDSINEKLIMGEKCIFEADKFLRGLSITDEYIFVGGTDICPDRNKRISSGSEIYVLNRQGELLTKMIFPELGGVYEIRQLSEFDYAM